MVDDAIGDVAVLVAGVVVESATVRVLECTTYRVVVVVSTEAVVVWAPVVVGGGVEDVSPLPLSCSLVTVIVLGSVDVDSDVVGSAPPPLADPNGVVVVWSPPSSSDVACVEELGRLVVVVALPVLLGSAPPD